MTVDSSDSLDFLQMGFFSRQRTQKLLIRSDSHGERMQKVYALDYCAASFVTEGELSLPFPRFDRVAGARQAEGLGPRSRRAPLEIRQNPLARGGGGL